MKGGGAACTVRAAMAMYFQDLLLTLQNHWAKLGCIVTQGYDLEVGAGTMAPQTFLRALGPEPWNVAYIQPSRRPADGRFGENPNRLFQHHQFQVILKPAPKNVQELYLDSIKAFGIDPLEHDIRFVEDDWESPSLGASGLGWEVWCDGMEITQFTYFQKCGGYECKPVAAELTYGLERIAMYLQGVDSLYDIEWVKGVKYGEVFHQNEVEMSKYALHQSDPVQLEMLFRSYETECKRLIDLGLPLPAYDYALKCSHAFNLLDARGAISVTDRAGYIKRVRDNAALCAKGYLKMRQKLDWPLCKTAWTVGEQLPMHEGKPASDMWKTVSFEDKEAVRG